MGKVQLPMLILLGLSAAFDIIDHELQFLCLQLHGGMNGYVLERLLAERPQSVISVLMLLTVSLLNVHRVSLEGLVKKHERCYHQDAERRPALCFHLC